jgi:RND family efflux transporter MFP subunit
MKTQRLTTFFIILIVIALGVGAVALRKARLREVRQLPGMGQAPWALHTDSVRRATLERGFPTLARLNGSTEILVSSQISGVIEAMGPREGVAVKKGALLARISVTELEQQRAGLLAQREAARAEQRRTQEEYQRQLTLKKKGLTTQELVDAKHAAAIAARKQVVNLDKRIAALDVRIGYGEVRAPRDALVAARLAEVGDLAQPGHPLYRLTVDSAARLRVKLPQQVLEAVHPGTEVELEHGKRHMRVRLSRIFPALDAQALGAAEADLQHMPFGLPSGARIPARVILQSLPGALVVPHRALIETHDGGVVFTLQGTHGKARLHRVKVKVMLRGDTGIAVSGELRPGERVVVAHQSVLMQLRDGDPVIDDAEMSK